MVKKQPFWWFKCPVCHKNIQKVYPDTVAYGTPFYCRFCKIEHFPAIWLGTELGIDEPFPVDVDLPDGPQAD